ncbi:RNA polymerase sigma factor FliA [Carnimonas bestiolae]|uniref:RNA polymerase sigma factor FliA n=1 Tax=Carnimonas bestiolae TaxID=3402172 RepID=UPI003EDB9687
MAGKVRKVSDDHQVAASRLRLQQHIKAAARRLQVQARLPANVDLNDLVQAGMVGLLEAETRFKEDQGASFETFASRRVQGAMLDELRGRDWLPRSIRRQARVIDRINGELEQRYGRTVRDRDIAEVMEVPLTQYHQHVNDINSGYLKEYDEAEGMDSAEDSSDDWVEEKLLSQERRSLLYEAIDAIEDEREREALILYHLKGLSLKIIGERLNVSESRVCQLHRRAITHLKRWLLARYPELAALPSRTESIKQ